MKLLVIGGGRFVGRALVQAAVQAGHAVTTFNRGSQPAPPGVEQRVGDRRADLSALATGHWDAVVDCCGYLPGEVEAMASALQGRVGRYLFISSVSAYADHAQPRQEGDPTGVLADPATEQVDGDTYGPLKAACEQVVAQRLGAQALCLRPTLVVGPHDGSGRFPWWPARLARARDGEPVLAPGTPDDPLQWIDARDLAAFVLLQAGGGAQGVLNVGSPAGAIRRGALLQACAEAAGVRPRWVWRSDAELLAAGVGPWMELPLWLPAEGAHAAFMQVDTRRAQALGLHTRSVPDTVADTLAWWRALPPEAQAFPHTGLAPAREQALLAGR